MNIGGTVINDDGEVVVGRPLVALDARGTRFEEMTDEGGGFWLMHAEPPYDLALDPSPSGLSPVPVVFLGLSRTDPRLEVSEHFEEPPPPAPRTLPTPPAPPRPVTPAQGGTLAASSAGIVWESEGAHVTIVTVTNAHGERLFRVFTEQNDVPFAKLEALGIPRLSLGTYTLELETSSASTLEAWTDPDAPRSDLGANDGTLVRFSFEVVAS